MANIYGRPGAEKDLLKLCPPEIGKYEDIEEAFKGLDYELRNEEKNFYQELPRMKDAGKQELQELLRGKTELENQWAQKIEKTKNAQTTTQKILGYLKRPMYSLMKTLDLKKTEKTIQNKQHEINELWTNPEQVFEKRQRDKKNLLERYGKIKKSDEYKGAQGELAALQELQKLDNRYNILCDVQIKLKDYVSYKGTKNLKSAQYDFIVVGPPGVYPVEVKNWSNRSANNRKQFIPHEQLDRAGLVLYIYLKNKYFLRNPPQITKILLPINGNMDYDPKYRSVMVKQISTINSYLQGKEQQLNEKQIEKAANLLKKRLRK